MASDDENNLSDFLENDMVEDEDVEMTDANLMTPESTPERRGASLPQEDMEIVDLTSPIPNPSLSEKEKRRLFSGDPREASDGKILAWQWEYLEERGDLKRLVIKLLRTLPPKTYSNFRKWAIKKSDEEIAQSIPSAIISLAKKLSNGRTDNMDSRPEPLIISIRLFLGWHLKTRAHFKYTSQHDAITTFSTSLAGILPELVAKEHHRDDMREDCVEFSCFLRQILIASPASAQESVADMSDSDVLSDGVEGIDEENEESGFKLKKRKRKLKEDKVAKRQRTEAMENSKMMDMREQQNLRRIGTDQVINPSKEEKDWILINDKAGSRLHQHQLEGIRFLWRQVVISGSGCLLSHTMGLGKTMQA
jgi:hypothetical protein